MKNIISLLSKVLLVIGLISMMACNTDNEGALYKGISGPEASFLWDKRTISITPGNSSFEIPVTRSNPSGSASASLTYSASYVTKVIEDGEEKNVTVNASELFSLPTSVSFAEGTSEVSLNIQCNELKAENSPYTVNIDIAKNDASSVGKPSLTLTINANK